MPLQATSGAASYDAFGGGVPVVPAYIEEVFSTYLYTGNGTSQTITNNIDLSGKGGLTWIKVRNDTWENILTDTVRGATIEVVSNATYANITNTDDLTAFTSSGFSVGNGNAVNQNNRNYVSWTFREQPKFFDVVTYTGTGSNTTIAHNLGSVPGCIMVKRTDTSSAWAVYHRSLANTQYLVLNTTAAAATGATWWNSTTPTSSVFSVGTDASVNASGGTYVAYIFAHNAGGFGLTGTDNVISCGSYTATTSNVTINLGYEPQWILVKNASFASDWFLFDVMRGLDNTNTKYLVANKSDAEDNFGGAYIIPTATGFTNVAGLFADGSNIIYIAIRRGPMKVPTDATKVFSPIARTGTGVATTISGIGFAPDLLWDGIRNTAGYGNYLVDKLRGGSQRLGGASTAAEATESPAPITQFGNTSVAISNSGTVNDSGVTYVNWFMQRAPSFFDEVCYTGNSTAGRQITHNLGVAPELMLIKCRSSAYRWLVIKGTDSLNLSTTDAASSVGSAFATTSTYFTVSNGTNNNASGETYVNYLFATCAGVSKVGSYTGNGTTQTIDCGFTGGARFVLIKRTDSTGGWYVYDTARGMTVLTDPYLLLNDTAAEVATLGSVTTVSTGFALNSTILAAINVSAASYIFLAIA